jgi:formylglycine-generating enzyme required for sulfatase activity
MAPLILFLASASVAEARSAQAGGTRKDARGVDQVWVPAGTFRMGSGDTTGLRPPRWAVKELASEQPEHPVRITRGFWMDTYEVTNARFREFVNAGGYRTRAFWSKEGWAWREAKRLTAPDSCIEEVDTHPRVCVSWYEAEAYARWRGGRLPTQAEWEYAARGPESRVYPWGNVFDPGRCNVVGSAGPVPVGSYRAGVSWVGAHDMAGNAMEWVQDWLGPDYTTSVGDDPPGPREGTVKIEKGGWWGSNPFVARAAYHHFEDPPTYEDHHIGFRIVSPPE